MASPRTSRASNCNSWNILASPDSMDASNISIIHIRLCVSFGISCHGTAVMLGASLNRRGVRQTTTASRAFGYSDKNVRRCRVSLSVGAS